MPAAPVPAARGRCAAGNGIGQRELLRRHADWSFHFQPPRAPITSALMNLAKALLLTILGLALALASATAGTTVGIYVGNNNFQNTGPNLRGCHNDANQYAAAFRQTLGAVEERILLDATLGGFLGELNRAISRARAGEVSRIIVTISSHGTMVPGGFGTAASQGIVFADAAASLDSGVLMDREFSQLISQVPATTGLELILDTCYSGGATRDLVPMALVPQKIRRYIPHPRFQPGVHTIARTARFASMLGAEHVAEWAAALESEESADDFIGGAYHGAFTYYWVQAYLANPAQPGSTLIGRVQRALSQVGYSQHPQFNTR
jgi:hypothetical protein